MDFLLLPKPLIFHSYHILKLVGTKNGPWGGNTALVDAYLIPQQFNPRTEYSTERNQEGGRDTKDGLSPAFKASYHPPRTGTEAGVYLGGWAM